MELDKTYELTKMYELTSNDAEYYIFLDACKVGDLNTIKGFLLDDNLPRERSLSFRKEVALVLCCEYNQVGIVKYLLTSKELKNCVNLYADNDFAFRKACSNNSLEVVKYLIFDVNIIKTKYIEDFLGSETRFEHIGKMFKIRELNGNLVEKFGNDSEIINNKKVKL